MFAASRNSVTTATQAPTRAAVLDTLKGACLPVANVKQQRHSGDFLVLFRDPHRDSFYTAGIESETVWAARVAAALPGATIVRTIQSVADWRPYKPVLSVTVIVAFPAKTQNARTVCTAQAL